MTSDRSIEFDIFLLDTDPAQTFELASIQCGITVNPTIFTGGTFSASIVAGTSALNPAQAPSSVTYTTGMGANIIKLSAAAAPGPGSGTILSSVSPGTRVVRIKLTSTVAFPANSYSNMAFAAGTAVVPSYATRVAVYQAGINTQLPVTPGTNANVLENPQLNSSFPIAYTVTGGGTCCDNGTGFPVGLATSQAGTTYMLYKNDIQTGPTISGTGAAINFPGNQTAGTFTVTGTNINGTAPMLNSVMVLMNPSPVPQIASNSPLCSGTSLILNGNPGSQVSYSWSGMNGFSSTLQNPVILNATTGFSGNYSLTVTNSFGCTSSTSTAVVVNSLPVPTIYGPGSICTGSTGINYSTEPGMTGYSWTVTGGVITTGAGTSTIAVNWGPTGAGMVTVNYTNSNFCPGQAPSSKSITISPVPVSQQSLQNITVASGQSVCSDAVQSIFVAGSGTTYTVANGGISHLIAGQNIIFYPGTTVQNGGTLHAYIADDCLYCISPKSSFISNSTDSISGRDTENSVLANELFRVFPNPTSGVFTLEMLHRTEFTSTTIELYGMQGGLISKMELNNQLSHTFNLADNPAGLYFIRVMAGKEMKTARIIKL
ncbi:MAG: T9SS type A sorting domain-containing protein [Bacteroidales bacterium]